MLKTSISLILLMIEQGGPIAAFDTLRRGTHLETLKVGVPAVMYTIQNNLILISLDNLSAAVQQVTYQMKILAAAFLMRLMLGKQLTYTKWFSLLILAIGVWLIQWPSDASQESIGGETVPKNTVLGLIAVIAACCVSGFAGVYTEMLLKQPNTSIWLRNVQIGFVGSLAALVGAFVQDGTEIQRAGLIQGYSWRVLLLIATTAFGGLLVAVVLKYADNILRQFSTALSIILTSIVSALVVRDVQLSPLFVLGTLLTIGATFMYNLGLPAKSRFKCLFWAGRSFPS
jgi:UDP-sugar transporter A1/2/3